METELLVDLLKLVFLVLVAFVTAWLHDYYGRRRRGDSYREHLFRERLQLYREIWSRYVALTRLLGTKGGSATVVGLDELTQKAGSSHDAPRVSIAEEVRIEVDRFVAFVRGSYILLDSSTVEALEQIIVLVEGKTDGGRLIIDWGSLNGLSQRLHAAIRQELGLDKLRNLEDVVRAW